MIKQRPDLIGEMIEENNRQRYIARKRAADRRSKNGPWDMPPAVEVSQSTPRYRDYVAMAIALAVLIVAIKAWRYIAK